MGKKMSINLYVIVNQVIIFKLKTHSNILTHFPPLSMWLNFVEIQLVCIQCIYILKNFETCRSLVPRITRMH
ncbi:hypothetical protein SAMN05216327_12619 [Dyadobacter sp. SG02]|nr:hypothetical protein SAMN05216327_12619 [Dyadobacter sp. SG02]